MKLALALLLLCGAAAVLAAPGDASASPSAGDVSSQLAGISKQVGQTATSMSTASNQLQKLSEVHSMLTAEAQRRKMAWRAKFGVKSGDNSEGSATEDKFGEWKQKNFPENGAAPAQDSGKDSKADAAADAVDGKMLKDVLEKAKEVSPLADQVNESLKKDLANMASTLGGFGAKFKGAGKKLGAAALTAQRQAMKEAAMSKLQTRLSQSRQRIKELHTRAKQLSAIERTHKRLLKKKLKNLAAMHRRHINKLIMSSRLQAIKLWLQHRRRQKLVNAVNTIKVTQLYQNHKKMTEKAMSQSSKALWSSFVKALQGHKGLKDEQRKAEEAIRRLHQRRMNKLKQDHQRKKAQIKRYVQAKYAAIMKAHFDRINRIRRKRQATLRALNQEVQINRQQQRRMERIVTDQESPSDVPDYERAFREKAARTRRLKKLYKAIKQQKKLMRLRAKTQQRLTQIQDKVGSYFDDLRTKLTGKLEKLDEVINSNQQKIDEAIEKERQRWKARMATRHLKERVSQLSQTITDLKSGTIQDLPDDIRQGLEREMAAKHHAKLREARRAARIAARNELQTTSFIEEDPEAEEQNSPAEPQAVTTDVEGSDENALVAGDSTMSDAVANDEDAFASEMPALMRELKSMRRMKAKISSGLSAAAKSNKGSSGAAKGGKGGKGKGGKKKKGGKKNKKKKKKSKRRRRNKNKRRRRKSKKNKKKKGGKKTGGNKGGKAKPAKGGRFAAADEGAASEATEAASEEVAEEATENSEAATEESSEDGFVDESALWRQFKASPDAVAEDSDDKGDKGSKGTKGGKFNDAEAAADSALAEASETDEDIMKDMPAAQ